MIATRIFIPGPEPVSPVERIVAAAKIAGYCLLGFIAGVGLVATGAGIALLAEVGRYVVAGG